MRVLSLGPESGIRGECGPWGGGGGVKCSELRKGGREQESGGIPGLREDCG